MAASLCNSTTRFRTYCSASAGLLPYVAGAQPSPRGANSLFISSETRTLVIRPCRAAPGVRHHVPRLAAPRIGVRCATNKDSTSTPEAAPSAGEGRQPADGAGPKASSATGFGGDAAQPARGKKRGAVRRPAPQQPLLGAQASEEEKQLESAVLGVLGLFFLVILGQGLFLSVSGFLPEEWDQFALNVVYPAFSPSVGIFVALAAAYGVLKALGIGLPKPKE